MEAARAAERVKHACTIDENELLALRPTLLRGYSSIHNQERSASCQLHTGNIAMSTFRSAHPAENTQGVAVSLANMSMLHSLWYNLLADSGCVLRLHKLQCIINNNDNLLASLSLPPPAAFPPNICTHPFLLLQ